MPLPTPPNETGISAPPDACWNRIGIRGDATCPELKRHVHCRNCPVHAVAASQFFNRPHPPGQLDASTSHFGERGKAAEQKTLAAFLFRIGTEWLALPPTLFQEAATLRPIHPLPHRRDGAVLGLVNIRGELLVCVALDRLLGIDPENHGPHQIRTGTGTNPGGWREGGRLLVIASPGRSTAFPVDEIHGIERFRAEEMGPVPTTIAHAVSPLTRGILPWRKGSAGYLDAEMLQASINRSLA